MFVLIAILISGYAHTRYMEKIEVTFNTSKACEAAMAHISGNAARFPKSSRVVEIATIGCYHTGPTPLGT